MPDCLLPAAAITRTFRRLLVVHGVGFTEIRGHHAFVVAAAVLLLWWLVLLLLLVMVIVGW